VPLGYHLLLGGWIAAMCWFASSQPERYRMAMQEDRIVEWATVWLFLAAGVIGASHALRGRRPFDGLVALFCLFVTGEEISWGQRLFGYAPPEYFLRNNFQQEVTLHNLPHSIEPGTILMLALAGYGLLLPLLSQASSPRRWMERAGATAPPAALMPWYAAAILLLWWYPFTLTGEWVELMAGGLFAMSTRPPAPVFWTIAATAAAFGTAMTPLSGALERGRDAGRTACARIEVQSLEQDVAAGRAGTGQLWNMERVHKRIWTSIGESYLDAAELRRFNAAACATGTAAADQMRRRYGIDPWGTAYWLLVESDGDAAHQVTVYSFGPNRQRDVDEHGAPSPAGDDIVASAVHRN
jgi:hypothetical protein